MLREVKLGIWKQREVWVGCCRVDFARIFVAAAVVVETSHRHWGGEKRASRSLCLHPGAQPCRTVVSISCWRASVAWFDYWQIPGGVERGQAAQSEYLSLQRTPTK